MMEGDRELRMLLEKDYMEIQPQISPDGRFIAYTSTESGRGEVYVRPFPDVNQGRWRVSTAGGNSPLWSPDGKELYYRNGEVTVAVSVETEPNFNLGKSETLFRGKYESFVFGALGINYTLWDISPDGKRFLMFKPISPTGAEPASSESQPKIVVVVNWFEELKEQVPVD